MIATLEKMLRDKDPQVVANCIVALEEIHADQGGIELNKSIIYHLLNRIREFSEWAQCIVLDLVARYTPENEKDVFDIMVPPWSGMLADPESLLVPESSR